MILGMNKPLRTHRGFTLIELLVVISIIGILSSVVLASLNSARSRAKDASIKAEVAQLATMMQLNFSDYGSYCQLQYGWTTAAGGTCSTIFSGTYASRAQQMCTQIFNNAGENNWGAPGGYKIYSNTSTGCATTYSFMIFLNNGNWYCSGSSGAKGEYASYGDPPNSNPGCYGNP